MLELGSGYIKYLYSGFDGTRPEILDQGRLEFPSNDWSRLFISLAESLKDIVTRKLPPFHQLETYLIPPVEMIIKTKADYLDLDDENEDEWLKWELSQTLLPEKRGYSIEYDLQSRWFNSGPDQVTGLALRNRYLKRLNAFFQKHQLFLNGVYTPHSLWKEIAEIVAPGENNIHLLVKDGSACTHIKIVENDYPLIQFYGNNGGKNDDATETFAKMIESLSFDLHVNNYQTGTKVFVFKDNFDHNEVLRLKDQTRAEIISIGDNPLFPGLNDNKADYLLISAAHRKTSELFVCK